LSTGHTRHEPHLKCKNQWSMHVVCLGYVNGTSAVKISAPSQVNGKIRSQFQNQVNGTIHNKNQAYKLQGPLETPKVRSDV
jgi:hypothetical protein